MLALILAGQFVMPVESYAYIDPNTGGYVFQILFPVISAIAAVVLFFKNQAVSILKKIGAIVKKILGIS